MRATLIDPAAQERLELDGYARLELLDADEVSRLRETLDRLGPPEDDPQLACHSSFHSHDREYKRTVDAEIRQIVQPRLDATFDRQRALPSNFIVKWPGGRSGFGLHQDLSLVDERRHRSVEVWMALDDIDADNGQLWMVPGSHRWLPGNIRGIHAFPFAFSEVTRRVIEEHAVPVSLAAGEAVVFDHSVLHFSLPNRSSEPRRVAIADLIPQEAEHLHYFGDGAGGVEVFAIDDSFWTDNNPFTLWQAPPRSRCLGPVDVAAQSLGHEDLDALVSRGLAVRSDGGPRGAINAAKPWCHRCGSTDLDAPSPDRWVGNVTLLCAACTAAESQFAPSPAHIGEPSDRSAPASTGPRVGGPIPTPPAGVLRDPRLDRQLGRDGFVSLGVVVEPEVAGELREQYSQLHGWTGSGFEPDLLNSDVRYRHDVSDAIAASLDQVVGAQFVDHEPFLRNFLCKWPGLDSELYLHRDWMYVDERAGSRSYVAWVALEDIDGHNGQLRVLRGSHRVDGALRGTALEAPWLLHEDVIRARLESVPVTAGEVVVFDNALVHCSYPNNTATPRLVAAVGMRRRSTPLVYWRGGGETATRWDVDEEFFLTETPQSLLQHPPPRAPAETVRRQDVDLSPDELALRLDQLAGVGSFRRLERLMARWPGGRRARARAA